MSTPREMLEYVIDNELEFDFLTAITAHVNNYSIAEITDKKIEVTDGKCILKSTAYSLNLEITEAEIVAAASKGVYISAFISRRDDKYNVHFLVHPCKEEEKHNNEEAIAKSVIQYMIINTIIALRLDTVEKIKDYLKGTCISKT